MYRFSVLRRLFIIFTAAIVVGPRIAFADSLIQRATIPLLQPWSGSANGSTPILPGVMTFFEYFNSAIPLIFEVAVGFCVIWVVIGGIQIMVSGGGNLKSSGQSHITWALIGLLVLIFAGAILRVLNSQFFV